ncbi:MAG: DUF268 domain-containing protein [Sphingomonadaceae bacterium]|nr:DUF268 domain-containing protein [Sphingomonadaceae bacterium]
MNIARLAARSLMSFGFDPRKLAAWRHYPLYRKQRAEWRRQGGKIDRTFRILSDYADSAGSARGHYFHQDLLVARLVHEDAPKRHLDIGSRVDGFVAHLAAFRPVEVVDVRPLPPSPHPNITFLQADLMQPQELGQADSVSCLHAIEHFGLGRYTDPVDVDGHLKGITNLAALVATGGRLYLSVPIGRRDEVQFNAHRVFDPRTIPALECISSVMALERFDYVDDAGMLHTGALPGDVAGSFDYGCGIYTFRKRRR